MTDPDLDKPKTLSTASERLDMGPRGGKGAPEKRMTQEERDAEIKRQKAAADKARQDAIDKAYREKHGGK